MFLKPRERLVGVADAEGKSRGREEEHPRPGMRTTLPPKAMNSRIGQN